MTFTQTLQASVAVDEAHRAKSGAKKAYAKNVAEAFGYTAEQLQSIPTKSNPGQSCGNPVTTASIRAGEVVLDLGSGKGLDVFQAAAKVGPCGQVIGMDESADLIAQARQSAKTKNLKPPHVQFVHASPTQNWPIASYSVDCVLSNCQVNLLSLIGKSRVLKEAYRVLKPGGRMVLDDIVAKQLLPDDVRKDLASSVDCVSGSVEIFEYQQMLDHAGFTDVLFLDTRKDLNTPANPGFNANKWVASYHIFAMKGHRTSMQAPPPSVLLKWWDAYPAVKAPAALITPEEVATLVRDPARSDEYVVIDVRREDRVNGHIRGSHHWPAQAFHDALPEFAKRYGQTKYVIFCCGSSNWRGPRCAGWYQDYLNSEAGRNSSSTPYVLAGGAKAWMAKYGNDDELVES